MATTQDNRLLSISTPLGKDYLLLNKLDADEGMSQLFNIEVELLHEEEEAAFLPTVIDPSRLLGKGVTISVQAPDGAKRFFNGMVNRFSQGNRDVRFSYYHMSIVPHVWLLTQKSQSRIFQQLSVPDILTKVFQDFEVQFELQGTYEKRNYCVQYRETDFDFASRLMEEEGIFYYFAHEDIKHKLIIADTPQSNRDCPNLSTVPFFVNVGEQDYFLSAVNTFLSGHHLQTGKVTLWDHNFELPEKKLENEQTSRFTFGDNQKLESYDYPGGYARKYDGIERGGGAQAAELNKVFNDRETTTKNRMEALDAQVSVATGRSDACSFTAGYRFEMIEHPNSALNQLWVLRTVRHQAEQNPNYVSEEVQEPYTNNFTCIAHGAGKPCFRPLQKTPKPIIHGSQTAFVVGPGGEEIFVDKYGRVKVQFHWDRESTADERSSCWVRVAQGWAGKRWGMVFIPRIGMEVIVHFLEGDPDRPIITGCVYNPETMPPYTLPDEKTKSTIKSDSSKGGAGFNELRIEDKKGSEQIFIHAEKNQDIRVKNDCMELIKHDRHLIVENDQFEQVKKDKHLKVTGDHNEKVDGTISIEAGMDVHEKAGMNVAVEAGMGVHIKAGMTAVIEAGTSLTLKVGGNFININPGGVFVSGTMIMLNSGGAAGSGSGCSPDAPKQAKEADTADPGERRSPLRAASPPAPTSFSPLAVTFQSAAQSGSPFCDI